MKWKLFFTSMVLTCSSILFIINMPKKAIRQEHFIIRASIPYWDQENAYLSFKKNLEHFTDLNLFWYYLGETGEVVRYEYAKEDQEIIAFAHGRNVKVNAVITNLPEFSGATWDSERVEKVISNNNIRQYHINSILEKLKKLNFDGVIIDYESLRATTKSDFSLFIKELSTAVHDQNKTVTVVLHPKTPKSQKNGEYQDWEVISQYADQLQIMAYGEHWDESVSGPIASLPWVSEIISYSKTQKIPSEKLILGIPLYGYDWNKDNNEAAKGIVYSDAISLMKQYNAAQHWDQDSETPYFKYEKNGMTHEVWFENAQSISKKIQLAINAGFGGITFWRLGEEDPQIWKELMSMDVPFR